MARLFFRLIKVKNLDLSRAPDKRVRHARFVKSLFSLRVYGLADEKTAASSLLE